MNLQQLNQSGQIFKIFFLTAAIALLFTASSWWFLEKLNNMQNWLNSDEKEVRGHASYDLVIRLMLLAWLIKNGHTKWMVKTRAATHIIINSPIGFTAMSETFWSDWQFDVSGLSACQYVLKYLRNPPRLNGPCWSVYGGYWEPYWGQPPPKKGNSLDVSFMENKTGASPA